MLIVALVARSLRAQPANTAAGLHLVRGIRGACLLTLVKERCTFLRLFRGNRAVPQASTSRGLKPRRMLVPHETRFPPPAVTPAELSWESMSL